MLPERVYGLIRWSSCENTKLPASTSATSPPAGDEINLPETLTVEVAIAEAARLLRAAELEAAVDGETPTMDRFVLLASQWTNLAGFLLAAREQQHL